MVTEDRNIVITYFGNERASFLYFPMSAGIQLIREHKFGVILFLRLSSFEVKCCLFL